MTLLRFSVLILLTPVAYAQRSGTFAPVGDFRGIGHQLVAVVGPGPTPGSERLYASYVYAPKTFDLVAIDPDTGSTEVFPDPTHEEYGAWGMTDGPDGNIYLGTLPHAHFLKLDRKQGALLDLGRPSSSEQYIWDVVFGSDGRLYGVTSPNCKLVTYDPATRRLDDLGRLDPTESYARSVVASDDGFIYVGIGSNRVNIAAYEIRTGQHREILPENVQGKGFARVYRGPNGEIFGAYGTHKFRLTQWSATELEPGLTAPAAALTTLRDKRDLSLSVKSGALIVTAKNPSTHANVDHETAYSGHSLSLARIGFGPDGLLYGSSELPASLIRANANQQSLEEIGSLGSGEVYSFLSYRQRLLIGAYSDLSSLMSYQPALPFQAARESGNPVLVSIENSAGWRPMDMVAGADGSVYVGIIAGYGQLESPLIEWNPETNSVKQYAGVVHDESIYSLTTWHNLIIGGTSISGGSGSHATQKDAKLFIWDTKTHHKDFETVVVPGAENITDLITAPNNLVYGVAGNTLFEFDPATKTITRKTALPFSGVIYNCVSLDGTGKIWGLAHSGIFTIDPKTFKALLIAKAPVPITGGFAMKDGKVYFTSGSSIYQYTM